MKDESPVKSSMIEKMSADIMETSNNSYKQQIHAIAGSQRKVP